MPDALLSPCGNKLRAYLVGAKTHVATLGGTGLLVYLTSDGYLGVRLAGESRVDEWPAEQCRVVAS